MTFWMTSLASVVHLRLIVPDASLVIKVIAYLFISVSFVSWYLTTLGPVHWFS